MSLCQMQQSNLLHENLTFYVIFTACLKLNVMYFLNQFLQFYKPGSGFRPHIRGTCVVMWTFHLYFSEQRDAAVEKFDWEPGANFFWN